MSISDESSRLDAGTAGASARREHDRRRTNRERRIRERHPHTAGLRLALGSEPTHQTAWARGAAGEERVAESLAKHLAGDAIVLHDRRVPGSRANIDHIVVARSGVWVIDAKRYKGKVSVSRPLFGKAKLLIAGRDQTKLIEGLVKQVAVVEAALAEEAGAPPVRGALCFVDSDLPLLGKLTFDGFALAYPKALAKRINAGRPVLAGSVPQLADRLARRLPPA